MRETEIRRLFTDSAQDIQTAILDPEYLSRRGLVAKRRRARQMGIGAIVGGSALVLGTSVLIASWTGGSSGSQPTAGDPDQSSLPVLSKGDWSSTGLIEQPRIEVELGVDSSNCFFVLRDGTIYDVVWPKDYSVRMNDAGSAALIVGPDDQPLVEAGDRFAAAGGQLDRTMDLNCSVAGAQGVVGVFRIS